jgi:hypothetical protein
MLYQFPDWMYKTGKNSPCYIASENIALSEGDKATLKTAYPFENVAAVLENRRRGAEMLRSRYESAALSMEGKERALSRLETIGNPDLPRSERRERMMNLMVPEEQD